MVFFSIAIILKAACGTNGLIQVTLNKFTDYGLRLLMYLLQSTDCPVTIAQAAKALHVSEHHLVKVAHFMTKKGWIVGTRGKGGGIRLVEQTRTMPLGELVRCLEGNEKLVNCHQPPCVLRLSCNLKGVLDTALEQFYQYLNTYQLQDSLRQSTDHDRRLDLIHLVELTAQDEQDIS